LLYCAVLKTFSIKGSEWRVKTEVIYENLNLVYKKDLKRGKKRYPDAEAIDESGIWNTPYEIDGDSDNYPLMEPFENYIT
jgi:hypothetical protein